MTIPFASVGAAVGARLNRRSIPNVPVLSHDGAEHRFYEDLVRDQTVIIHFMSIEAFTRWMARVSWSGVPIYWAWRLPRR